MATSIARAEATICICFVDGAVADRLVVLDYLEKGYESEMVGTFTPERSKGGAELLKKRVGVMRSFCGSWNPAFLSFTISMRVRLVPILTGHIVRIGGRSWSGENLSTHLRSEPLTQRSMSSGQIKTSRI